ncbi:glycerophosphodiester phosphodiesterase [Paenibacillus marinisediminis]
MTQSNHQHSVQVPLIIAHRGSAGEAPENTLGSFRLALEQHCDAIELDIQLTKEGIPVVIHDATVNRTTNGRGAVHEMTLEQIQALDAGSWFDSKYAGERVPTLAEVFDLVPASIMINVEIKQFHDDRTVPQLLKLLEAYDRFDSVVVSSFDHKCLKRLKEADDRVKIGLLYNASFVDHAAMAGLVGVPVYSLHPQGNHIGPEDITGAQQAGLRVYPYTINQVEHYKLAIHFGVDGIITDYPGRLYSMLHEQ